MNVSVSVCLSVHFMLTFPDVIMPICGHISQINGFRQLWTSIYGSRLDLGLYMFLKESFDI